MIDIVAVGNKNDDDDDSACLLCKLVYLVCLIS